MSQGITKTIFLSFKLFAAAMAEWLRRLTRNQVGSSRAGSNPAGCDCQVLKWQIFKLMKDPYSRQIFSFAL